MTVDYVFLVVCFGLQSLDVDPSAVSHLEERIAHQQENIRRSRAAFEYECESSGMDCRELTTTAIVVCCATGSTLAIPARNRYYHKT